jgi:hypothetical protein
LASAEGFSFAAVLEKRRIIMTAAEVLYSIAMLRANWPLELQASEFRGFFSQAVVFNDEERETGFLPFEDPQQFYEEVEEIMKNGWRPVAISIHEDIEDEFPMLEYRFLSEKPTVEDQAIIDSIFEAEEEGIHES